MATIMVSCGETSGDLHAGGLCAELRKLDPGGRVLGLGGERFRAAGGELIGDFRGLAVTGLTEALAVLPRSFVMFRRLVAAARRERPDALVVIDFADFNFRLAKAVSRLGVPIVYYVPPQIWAWRIGRLGTIKRLAARVLVIFPFEEALYRDAGVPVEFVGHPFVDCAEAVVTRSVFLASLGLDPTAPTIALLPGSRPNEIRAILPVLVRASALIAERIPRVQFVLARAPGLAPALFAPLGAMRPAPVIVDARPDDVLAASDVVLTCSGTATVQAAVHERPMVVMYRLSPLTYRLGKPFLRVDTYGMVNLVAGRRIVPELIQDDLQPEAVAAEAVGFLTDPVKAASAREALREVKLRLGLHGASRRAAEAVLRVARHEA
jgi:lipid-A-disaccharide synthase